MAQDIGENYPDVIGVMGTEYSSTAGSVAEALSVYKIPYCASGTGLIVSNLIFKNALLAKIATKNVKIKAEKLKYMVLAYRMANGLVVVIEMVGKSVKVQSYLHLLN
ncbi:UNVERIFIED_CONTAM: hypothetical protein HDU68_012449 [Siphonaria sp. JEL0065]|nr:hypothetical protein HDU68_012449 [Siphonaria sp. JEL0065]